MYCERCQEQFKWYENVCPRCQRALVPDPAGIAKEPDAPVVRVFRTADEGRLPLAAMALDEAGIEYAVRKAGLSDVFGVSHPTPGFESTGTAVEIHVLAADAERARDLLVDLERASDTGEIPPEALEADPAPRAVAGVTGSGSPPIELFDVDTDRRIGTISDAALEWLSERLELESDDDDDYYIDAPTIDMLEQDGAAADLLAVLRHALGDREGISIRWT